MTVRQDSGIPEFQDHVNTALDRLGKVTGFKETAPAKIFQTQHAHGFLFSVRQPGSESRQYIIIRTNTVGLPSVLQRTTASIIAQALKKSSSLRCRAVAAAKCSVRLICSDRYAAQFLAESWLQADRPGWCRLHIGCEIHKSTACQAKGLLLAEWCVSGCIR
eukprot:9493735-Pyramimonas_sp.AAC.1